MAKHKKGKSGRRVKGWQERYQAGEDTSHLAHRGRKLAARAVKLPASRLVAPEENLEELPKAEGLVVATYRRGSTVRTAEGPMFCAIAKTFRAPGGSSGLAVGDVVTVAVARERFVDGPLDIDGNRVEGMILARQPRQTALSRPRPTSAKRQDPYQAGVFEQVIAANMDVLLIVASTCQPPLRPRLIERFLIVAERGEMRPVVMVNKIDLAAPEPGLVEQLRELGPEVVLGSARTGQGLEGLRRLLAGRRSVLAGASGVGKSTLINALVPGADAATGEIRMKDQRGRHTTAATAVYELPACELPPAPPPPAAADLPKLPFDIAGGLLVDTPGVRELALAIEPEQLPWYFPEFEPHVPHCRFSNCTHIHEPDCAVLAAVQAGQIPFRRYESYARMRQSLEEAP